MGVFLSYPHILEVVLATKSQLKDKFGRIKMCGLGVPGLALSTTLGVVQL